MLLPLLFLENHFPKHQNNSDGKRLKAVNQHQQVCEAHKYLIMNLNHFSPPPRQRQKNSNNSRTFRINLECDLCRFVSVLWKLAINLHYVTERRDHVRTLKPTGLKQSRKCHKRHNSLQMCCWLRHEQLLTFFFSCGCGTHRAGISHASVL